MSAYPVRTRSLPVGTRVLLTTSRSGIVGTVLLSSDGTAKVAWGDADPVTAIWHAIFQLAPLSLADPDECGHCDGDGDVRSGLRRHTCPVCRGSGLSGSGEAKLRTGGAS